MEEGSSTLESTGAIATEITWQKEWLRRRSALIDQLVSKPIQVRVLAVVITDPLAHTKYLDQDELAKPYQTASAPDRTQLLRKLLEGLAQISDLKPPTLPLSLDIPTIDYLLRLVIHPFATSPSHPALRKEVTRTVINNSSRSSCQIYMRCRPTTLGQLLSDMKRFVGVYESEYRR
jgi:hypothetical protein